MTTSERHGLSLVIAAHNEESCIVMAIEAAHDALKRCGVPFEVIVVDDGSDDDTAALVNEMASSRTWLSAVSLASRHGKGRALRTGFERAVFDTLGFVDADLEVPVECVIEMLPRLESTTIAVGYRVGRISSPGRRALSAGYRVLARLLLGVSVRDVGCPLKVFSRRLFEDARLTSSGWVIDAELLAAAKRLGYRVDELPVPARLRDNGCSQVRPVSAAVSGTVGLLRVALVNARRSR